MPTTSSPGTATGMSTEHRQAAAPTLLALPCLGLAAWLFLARNALAYELSDARTDAFLNEAVCLIAVAMLGVTLLLSSGSRQWAALVAAASGLWLMIAPFVIGYADVLPEAGRNGVACGALALALGAAALVTVAPDPHR